MSYPKQSQASLMAIMECGVRLKTAHIYLDVATAEYVALAKYYSEAYDRHIFVEKQVASFDEGVAWGKKLLADKMPWGEENTKITW